LVVEGEVVGGTAPARTAGIIGIGNTVNSTGELEEARRVDEATVGIRAGLVDLVGSTEGGDGRRKSINGIRVVEGLGAERAEEDTGSIE
jgi:hypothetical protein